MVQRKNNKKISILSQIQSNWGWITILLACGGAGFWLGQYNTAINLNAKINELENQNQLHIIDLREKNLELWEKYQNDIIDLKKENSILQTKINIYKNEKAR